MPLYMEWDRRRSFAYPSILRGARTVMSEHDVFDRVLAAVHAATLDETRWPATSVLIDEACGLTGNGLMVGEGPTNDVRALFVGLYYRGQRRDDLEREYLTTYHPIDERVPRFRHLPARRLVHITDLYTAEELKTSRTYNEILRRAGMQDGLNVQLPGLAGSHIGWGLNDPADAAGWGSSRITMVERLLPHIQQFVHSGSAAHGFPRARGGHRGVPVRERRVGWGDRLRRSGPPPRSDPGDAARARCRAVSAHRRVGRRTAAAARAPRMRRLAASS